LSTATSISLRSAVDGGPLIRNTITLTGPDFALTIYEFQVGAGANLTQTEALQSTYFGIASVVTTGPYEFRFTNTQSFSITNLGPSPAPIPEPTSWALMLLGFGGLGSVLRQRRRSEAARLQLGAR
jgi:hypothetical protein